MILWRRCSLFALTLLMLPTAVHAQFQTPTPVDPFTLSLSPQYPLANSSATLVVQSTVLSLPDSTLTISVAGKEVYKGNVKPVSVPIGPAGKPTTILVTLSSAGKNYAHTITVRPSDVMIVQEPVTSAPPLYAGKPLPSLSGMVRLVAVADFKDASGKQIPLSSLSYSWTENGSGLQNSSGIGKNTIVVSSPLQYRSNTFTVTVRSSDQTLAGGATTNVDGFGSSVRVYVNDPLMGVLYDHAVTGNYTINGSEASLIGVPYSFSLSKGLPVLTWFLNGARAQTGAIVTLRPQGSGKGNANLSFTATTGGSAPETANTALTVTFTGANSTGIFGL